MVQDESVTLKSLLTKYSGKRERERESKREQ